MPNLPAVGATFASAAAFEAACVLAVIRIYGYSVSKRSPTSTYSRVQCNYRTGSKSHRCPFALVARKDLVTGRWVVRDTAGPRLHNHGRNPNLVRDSMWVPTVVCETARAALGLPPGKRARDKARRAKEKKRAKAEAKKERLRGKKRKRDDEADADTLMVRLQLSSATCRRSQLTLALPSCPSAASATPAVPLEALAAAYRLDEHAALALPRRRRRPPLGPRPLPPARRPAAARRRHLDRGRLGHVEAGRSGLPGGDVRRDAPQGVGAVGRGGGAAREGDEGLVKGQESPIVRPCRQLAVCTLAVHRQLQREQFCEHSATRSVQKG